MGQEVGPKSKCHGLFIPLTTWITIFFIFQAFGSTVSLSLPTLHSPPDGHIHAYTAHWDSLLTAEYKEAAEVLSLSRRKWSRSRLENAGLALFGASAEPESEVYGDKIIRMYRPGPFKLRDKFSRGDVLMMTPTLGVKEDDIIPRECLIVDVGDDWLTAGVGTSWPKGLWEARKMTGFFQVRLDRTAARAPLRAQQEALDLLRKGNAGELAVKLADLRLDSRIDLEKVDTVTSPLPRCLQGYKVERGQNLHLEHDIRSAIEMSTNSTSFKPNQSQKDAIAWALQRTVSLIRGPPGTGKTRVAALLIAAALKLQYSKSSSDDSSSPRILAVAHSNGAADVLLEALLDIGVPAVRIGRPASVSTQVVSRTVVAMAERMPSVINLRQQAANVTLDRKERSRYHNEVQNLVEEFQDAIVASAPVVVSSCIGARQLLKENEDRVIEPFPLVVLDEAAQSTEPALVVALASAKAEQLILVGDTRQLPPTVTSIDLQKSLGKSPMERLEKLGVGQKTLGVQYRMSSFLLDFPSRQFYDGCLTCAQEVLDIEEKGGMLPPSGFPWKNNLPLAFVQIGNGDSEQIHSQGGKSNPQEAKMICRIVGELLSAGDIEASDLAIISPYAKQVQLIRAELASQRGQIQDVSVGTVDSFQGQEVEVVLFSAVRSNPLKELGFLRDSRRLCVAITRARRGLILLGDKSVLKTSRYWRALLESCEEHECFLSMEDFRIDPIEVSSSEIPLDELFPETLSDDLHDLF
jgi:hypothetical protein